MSFTLLFAEIKHDGVSTVSHPIAWVCMTQAQTRTGYGISTDLCLRLENAHYSWEFEPIEQIIIYVHV